MTRALVLGSTGRIGRVMRHIWTTKPDAFSTLTWTSRSGAPGTLKWALGDPTGGLPHADVVIALIGGSDEDGLAIATLNMANDIGANRVLLCSTDEVYPPSLTPRDETDDTDPCTPMGLAKVGMEQAVGDWVAKTPFGPMPCIMRLGHVAGADDLFDQMDGGTAVVLDQFNDENGPLRSWLAPQDLARALIALGTCPDRYYPPVVNLAGPRPVATQSILRAAEHQFDWRPATDTAIQSIAMDTGRIGRLNGELVQSSDPGGLVSVWREMR